MNKYKKYFKEITYLLGDDLKQIPKMTLAFICASLLDLIGIGLVAPYVTIVLNPDGFNDSVMSSLFENLGFSTSTNDVVTTLGIFLLIVFALKVFASFSINKMILSFSYTKAIKIRSSLMRSYQSLEYSDYLKRNSSNYIYSILNLSAKFSQGVAQSVLRIISEGIVITFIFILLFINNSSEVITFIFLISTFFISYSFFFRKKIVNYGRLADSGMKVLVKGINEGIGGLKEIRVLNKENFFYDKVVDSSKVFSSSRVSAGVIKGLPRNILEFIIVLFIVSIIVTAISTGKEISDVATTLGMFGVAAMRLIPSTNHIMAGLINLGDSRNSVNLLYNDLKELEGYKLNTHRKKVIKDVSFNSIELKNINFSYAGARPGALSNISLKINAGDSIGLIGTSGSGKSTLIDILLAFLTPESGDILFNNEVLTKTNLDNWLNNVAYLPQHIFMTDDTIRKNIALGTPENVIDDEKVRRALIKSNLSEFVDSLENGANTIIGERGTRLSGGQQQRIAIARAFYFERNVLVMDEATSALDNKTENEIVEEIKNLKGTNTMIVIAHRLSTLRYCDLIYRIENGKVVETGTYSEIIGVQTT
jgi:ABC-type bacteriocin/lantibiotic exporter with double-glycine peptidase domain